MRPTVASSLVRPSCSAQAVRTAGATWTTVVISGSSSAAVTLAVSSRMDRAPVGQCVIHCPQSAQSASVNRRFRRTPTVVREPLPFTSQTFNVWILSQTSMQRMHLMHLLSLRIR